MRVPILLLPAPFLAALLLASAATAAAPALALFGDGFPAGLYADSRSATARTTNHCLKSADAIVHAGRAVGPSCRVTVLEDTAASAIVQWTCRGGDSGRSEIRRDHAGLFTVRSQGIANRLPFGETHEWRRIGDC
jgi:hypothetical protein